MNTKRFIHDCIKGGAYGGILSYAGLNLAETPLAFFVCLLLLIIVSSPIDYTKGD